MRNEKKTNSFTGNTAKKALTAAIFGCIVIVCLLLIILFSWKRLNQPVGMLQNTRKVISLCATVGLNKEQDSLKAMS